MSNRTRRLSVLAVSAMLAAGPVSVSAQTWASWNSGNGTSVLGTLLGNAITYTGTYSNFDNSNLAGLGYWSPSGAYSQNGLIAPTNAGLVRFTPAGRGSIIFSSAVLNPYIAFNSVGAPGTPVTYDFQGSAFNVLSNNNTTCAYWGCGSFSTSGNTLTGVEFSGVARFVGTFTQIDFSFTAEGWHGITVGADAVAGSTVPEPSTYALMAAGMLGVFAAARRRRV